MTANDKIYDAVVVGGGPAGATAALVLARAGLSVRLLERARFPRFHIGESFLPANLQLIRELGLEPALRRLPQVDKRGVEFAVGHGRSSQHFQFADCLLRESNDTFNIERAPFDAMLLAEATAAGAEVSQDTAVRRIVRLAEGDVAVEAEHLAGSPGPGRGPGVDSAGGARQEGPVERVERIARIAARVLIDASGQATLVGKHLELRRMLPEHRKVAYFKHFEGVARRPGVAAGDPTMVMCDEGWFWIIPIDERRDSIGLVMDVDASRRVGLPADRMLEWGIARCPLLRQRTAAADRPRDNVVCADFSYRCRPYSGPGYFLVGDAATFFDPIFSTGVCLGMMAGVEAARGIVAIQREGAPPRRVRRRYNRFLEGSSTPLFRMVRNYYRHSFRELFLSGSGPLAVHNATLSVMAGSVFPRLVFPLRWRLELFHLMVHANHYLPLAPRREPFSLFSAEAEATAAVGPAVAPGQRTVPAGPGPAPTPMPEAVVETVPPAG